MTPLCAFCFFSFVSFGVDMMGANWRLISLRFIFLPWYISIPREEGNKDRLRGWIFGAHDTSNMSMAVSLIWTCGNCPPIIPIIPRFQNSTTRSLDVPLQFRFLIKMIISMKGFWRFVRAVLCRTAFEDPGNHHVLAVTFVPTSTAIFLFKRPGIYQGPSPGIAFSGRPQRAQDFLNCLGPSLLCG